MVTAPLKLSVGTNLSDAACDGVSTWPAATGVTPSARYKIPCVANGKVGTLTLAMVPSTSAPVKFSVAGLSSSTVVLKGVAVGASFTELIVTVTVAVSVTPPLVTV